MTDNLPTLEIEKLLKECEANDCGKLMAHAPALAREVLALRSQVEQLCGDLKAAQKDYSNTKVAGEKVAGVLCYVISVREIKCKHSQPECEFCARCMADAALAQWKEAQRG